MKPLPEYAVFQVDVGEIYFDEKFNNRTLFSPQSVQELAQSIGDHGLQLPIILQPYDRQPGYKYRIVAGHRRFRAVTTFLNWATIPAMVRELTDHEASLLNVLENLERKDLNIMEEALAIQHLYPNGVYISTAASELKRPTRWVQIRLKLLTLPDQIQRWAAAGMLSTINLEAIAQLNTVSEQMECAKGIIDAKKAGIKKTPDNARRSFKPKRGKSNIADMISYLYGVGLDGLPTRLLAWAAGTVTLEEIENDIQEELGRRIPHDRHRETETGGVHPPMD